MPGIEKRRVSMPAVLLTLLTLPGCATLCADTPPQVLVAPGPKLTPLPPSIVEIEAKSSQDFSKRASLWLQKVADSLTNATPK